MGHCVAEEWVKVWKDHFHEEVEEVSSQRRTTVTLYTVKMTVMRVVTVNR